MPGPHLFMADWLSRHNHKENKDEEITDIQISISLIQSTTNIPEYMIIHELQEATSQDQHFQHLMGYIIQGWLDSKTSYHKTLEHNGCSEMIWQLLMGQS